MESRIREYTREQARIAAANAQMADLEAQVEETERRNLRLTRELNEEVALRARAERFRDEAKKELAALKKQLLEGDPNAGDSNSGSGDQGRSVEGKGTDLRRKDSGTGGKVSASRRRGAGSTKSGTKRSGASKKPAAPPSDGDPTGTPEGHQGSRKRGNVK